jgi:hypothetical protein
MNSKNEGMSSSLLSIKLNGNFENSRCSNKSRRASEDKRKISHRRGRANFAAKITKTERRANLKESRGFQNR